MLVLDKDVYKTIKKRLVDLEMSQCQLAEKLGVSNQLISQIARGVNKSKRVRKMIEDALGIEILYTDVKGERGSKKSKSMTDIQKTIKKRLVDLEMSQYQLAEKLGVSNQLISKILNGINKSFRVRKLIEVELGIKIWDDLN